MKNELLVISDNFNEYSKYRCLLESAFSVSLRTSKDEVDSYLKKHNDDIELIIIDMDDIYNNGLNDYVNIINQYENISYFIIVDLTDNLNNDNFIDGKIISRQSIYPNLKKIIDNKISINIDNMEELYYDYED